MPAAQTVCERDASMHVPQAKSADKTLLHTHYHISLKQTLHATYQIHGLNHQN